MVTVFNTMKKRNEMVITSSNWTFFYSIMQVRENYSDI